MKRTKLLTSLAALALVIGLGACEETEVEEPSDDSSESVDTDITDTTTGAGGDTGDAGDTGDGGDAGDDGDTGDGSGNDGESGDTGDAGDDSGDDGDGDGNGDGNDDGDGDTADNTETETLYISELDYLCFSVNDDDSYIYGKTCESLTSCNVTFDQGDFTGTRWSSNYIRLYENATITFTPKDGHTLVGLSVSWYTGTSSKAISIVDNAASVTNSDTGAEITDIVDGSQTLTVKNAGGANEQLYFGNVEITYY